MLCIRRGRHTKTELVARQSGRVPGLSVNVKMLTGERSKIEVDSEIPDVQAEDIRERAEESRQAGENSTRTRWCDGNPQKSSGSCHGHCESLIEEEFW